MSDVPVLLSGEALKKGNRWGDLEERSHSSDPQDWPVYSFSQTRVIERCEFEYHLIYREGFHAGESNTGQNTGTKVHEGMDVFYGNGMSYEAVDLWMREEIAGGSLADVVVLKKALLVLKRYCSDHAPVVDLGIKVVGTELHVTAHFVTDKGRHFWIQAYIDLLVQRDKVFEVIDHKTTSQGFWTQRQVQMDPQNPIYCAILREAGIATPSITTINMLNTYDYKNFAAVENSKLFKRISVPRSDIFITEVLKQFKKLVDKHIENYKTPRMSLDKSCSSCNFSEACTMKLQGLNARPFLEREFRGAS